MICIQRVFLPHALHSTANNIPMADLAIVVAAVVLLTLGLMHCVQPWMWWESAGASRPRSRPTPRSTTLSASRWLPASPPPPSLFSATCSAPLSSAPLSFTPLSITLPAVSASQWLRPYPASVLNTTDRTSGCESLKLSPVVWDKHADKFYTSCMAALQHHSVSRSHFQEKNERTDKEKGQIKRKEHFGHLKVMACMQDVVQQGREESQARRRHRRCHGRLPRAGRQGNTQTPTHQTATN